MSSTRTPTTLFADLSGNTTMHGLKYTYSSKHRTRQVLWVIIFLGVVGGFTWHLSRLILKLMSHPVNTEVTFTREDKLDFPAVTVCNINPVKLSYKDEVLNLTKSVEKSFNRTDSTYYDKPVNYFNSSTSENGTTSNSNTTSWNETTTPDACVPDIYNRCEGGDGSTTVNSTTAPVEYNATKREYSSKMRFYTNYAMISAEKRKTFGHQYKDMVLSCTFAGDACDQRNFDPFQTVSNGNCFTFNMNTGSTSYKRKRALGVGPIEGMT